MNALAVNMRTAADMVGMSERYISDAIKAGDLPARKVGRSIRVEVAALTEWFRTMPATTDPVDESA